MFHQPPVSGRRLSFFAGAVAGAMLLLACAAGEPQTALQIRLAGDAADNATIRLEGIPRAQQPRQDLLDAQGWAAAFRVTVAGSGDAVPPVAGTYSVDAGAVVFKPLFGLDPGRTYRAEFDAARLSEEIEWRPEPVVSDVALPARTLAPTTVVSHIFPSSDTVPENQLRLYIHFSAPMGRRGGLDYVRLVDDRGETVVDPFLPLDAEFWNSDRTRYTIFFDPGRQKRGILPNQQMGRSLEPGRTYTLVVSREWLDGEGLPLKEEFRRPFRVVAADERPLNEPSAWQLQAPAAAGRAPLVVTFDEPLDHGLLLRALGVTNAAGEAIEGSVQVSERETRWQFTPNQPWKAGPHRLKILSILEDLAGNRIGRAFEVDAFERADRQAEPEAFTRPFVIGAN